MGVFSGEIGHFIGKPLPCMVTNLNSFHPLYISEVVALSSNRMRSCVGYKMIIHHHMTTSAKSKFTSALLSLFSPPDLDESRDQKNPPTTRPSPVLLTQEPNDKRRNDEYLPRKGDSGRAVRSSFSCS